MKILLTGFEGFDGETINPSWESIKDIQIGNNKIFKIQLPVVFGESISKLKNSLDEIKPDIIFCIGQAGGESAIRVERIAINIDDARIPDNDGNQPIDSNIFQDGANAYFSNLPIKAIVNEIKKEKIPAYVSNSAGTFVCNHVMYGLMYYIKSEFPNSRGGFIHVPYIPEQISNKKNMSSMNIIDIQKAIEIAIITSIKIKDDIKSSGGSLH